MFHDQVPWRQHIAEHFVRAYPNDVNTAMASKLPCDDTCPPAAHVFIGSVVQLDNLDIIANIATVNSCHWMV
jgi:hypothetical protein